MNSSFMAMSAAGSFFAQNRPEFADNVKQYYEHIRENDLCNNVYGKTGAVVHMQHQVTAKNVAKTELLLGLACQMVEIIQLRRAGRCAGDPGGAVDAGLHGRAGA